MATIYDDNSLSIGRTPLVRLNRVTGKTEARVLAKIEGRNPAYSVKCRVGAAMIWDAEEKGLIKPHTEIIEPTSGNTGIALAFVCAARGYKLTLTMPETMSLERRKVLAFFGANLLLTPGSEGMKGAIRDGRGTGGQRPRALLPAPAVQQPGQPGHPREDHRAGDLGRHRRRGRRAGGRRGHGRHHHRHLPLLRSRPRGKPLYSVAVEPATSPVISQTLAGQELKPGPHKIQGIGAGFIPENLDLSLVDRVEPVKSEEAMEMARRLAREEGILCGISSGAATVAAARLAGLGDSTGKTIVVILPDAGERYLSTELFA